MKSIITLFFMALLGMQLNAQAPSNFINYQGIAADSNGDPLVDQTVNLQIALRFGTDTSMPVYIENHTVTTNATGGFALQIGNGSPLIGDFSTLTWGAEAAFVGLTIDGTDMGSTEMQAVPFALNVPTNFVEALNDLSDAKYVAERSSLFIGDGAGANFDETDTSSNNSNLGIGNQALHSFTTGIQNTAVGIEALKDNTIGIQNTAVGAKALGSNTTGGSNTAVGNAALLNNTTGGSNTALGGAALLNNTTGGSNTAVGNVALLNNTTGRQNVAVGQFSLFSNTTGGFNNALGYSVLENNTTGSYNNSIGYFSLSNNTTGEFNTAIGNFALNLVTTGSNNIGIGNFAQVPSNTGSNQVRIGNTEISYAGIQVAWTVTSDQWWKEDIRTLPYGLDLVKQLKPVDYLRKNDERQKREIGFIAQDVELLLAQMGYHDQGMLTKDDDGRLSLRYNDFIPLLTKAIQEQQGLIEDQQLVINQLLQRVEALEAKQ